jgi:hypothetical protein
MNRTSITVIVVLGVAIVGSVASAVIWFKNNGAKLAEETKAAYEDGKAMGKTMNETACMDAILTEHKANPLSPANIFGVVKRGRKYDGCLYASKIDPPFCEGIPPATEIMTVAAWSQAICAKRGMIDQHCPQLVQTPVSYCAYERGVKERLLERKRSAQGGSMPADGAQDVEKTTPADSK